MRRWDLWGVVAEFGVWMEQGRGVFVRKEGCAR